MGEIIQTYSLDTLVKAITDGLNGMIGTMDYSGNRKMGVWDQEVLEYRSGIQILSGDVFLPPKTKFYLSRTYPSTEALAEHPDPLGVRLRRDYKGKIWDDHIVIHIFEVGKIRELLQGNVHQYKDPLRMMHPLYAFKNEYEVAVSHTTNERSKDAAKVVWRTVRGLSRV